MIADQSKWLSKVGRLTHSLSGAIVAAILASTFLFSVYFLQRHFSKEETDVFNINDLWGAFRQWDYVTAFYNTACRCVIVLAVSYLLAILAAPLYFVPFIKGTLHVAVNTLRAVPVTLLAPMVVKVFGTGKEFLILILPIPVIAAIWWNGIAVALEDVSGDRLTYYKRIAKDVRWYRTILDIYVPEVIRRIRSDVHQAITYSVLLVVVVEYLFPPIERLGLGVIANKIQTSDAPNLHLLPIVLVVSILAALVVRSSDLILHAGKNGKR